MSRIEVPEISIPFEHRCWRSSIELALNWNCSEAERQAWYRLLDRQLEKSENIQFAPAGRHWIFADESVAMETYIQSQLEHKNARSRKH